MSEIKSKGTYQIKNSEYDYPCLTCEATGKVKDRSQHCPVEGYKYADKITCPTCRGTKKVDRAHYQDIFRKANENYRDKMEKYKMERAMYDSIMSKLTKEELEYIETNRNWWG